MYIPVTPVYFVKFRFYGSKLHEPHHDWQTWGNCNFNLIVMNYIFKVMESNL